MTKRAVLVLEDSTVYVGFSFGAEVTTCSEIVFDNAMAGYQGILTDTYFAGQFKPRLALLSKKSTRRLNAKTE